MVVVALPPARGSDGDSSTMSLAVRVSLRRFSGDGGFCSHLLCSSSLTRGSRRVSAGRCCGVFSGVFDVAGPSLPVVLSGLGVVSGPAFGACFPSCRRPWFSPPLGRLHPRCPVALGPPSGPAFRAAWRADFCHFCPAFSGPEGGVGDPGRGGFSPGRKKRTCVKKVRGGIQLRVVGFTRSALCNERSFRTDVSICTICRYGSDRASVQEKCCPGGGYVLTEIIATKGFPPTLECMGPVVSIWGRFCICPVDQLGKSQNRVHTPIRGTGGSLSKKMRLNCL